MALDLRETSALFAARHRDDYAWDREAQSWRRWNGQYWQRLTRQRGQILCDAAAVVGDAAGTVSSLDSVTNTIRLAEEFMARPFDSSDRGLVSFVNGTVNPMAWEKGEKSPLIWANRRDDLLTTGLPYPIEPGSWGWDATPATGRLLEGLLTQWDDWRCLLIHNGLAMMGDHRLHNVPALIGPPGCGKSTWLYFANAICGADDPRRMAPSSIFCGDNKEGDLHRDRLRDRLLVTLDEFPKAVLRNDELFKVMSAHGGVSYRSHHEMPDIGTWRPKLLLAANELPQFQDRQEALKRRLILLECDGKKPEATDLDMFDKLLQERPRVAFLCLYHAASIWRRDQPGYPVTARAIATYERTAVASDGFRFWLESGVMIGIDPEVREKRADVYVHYAEFCKESGYSPMSAGNFYEALRASGEVGEYRSKADRFLTGICLRPDTTRWLKVVDGGEE